MDLWCSILFSLAWLEADGNLSERGLHRKKRFGSFPSPAGMSLSNSPWAVIMTSKLNYSCPGGVWLVTSRLETGNSWTFFYGVARLSGSGGQIERLCNTEYKSTFATLENRLDTGRKHARLFYLLVEGKKLVWHGMVAYSAPMTLHRHGIVAAKCRESSGVPWI